MSAFTWTGKRHGRYKVYTDGVRCWYRCESGRADAPEWYVWDVATDNGEYVDANPAGQP